MQLVKEANTLLEVVRQLPDRYSVSVEAKERQTELVQLADSITGVSTAEQLEDAARIGSILQKEIKSVNEARLELARPVNETADKLIDLARDYTAPLVAQKDRLAAMVTSFRKSEEQRVAAEQRKRQEEIAKLERDRMKAEEAARKAAAKGNEEKAMAAEMKAYHATEAANAAIMTALPVVAKARGSSVRKVVKHEVTDIRKLYEARPELCHLEVKPSAINAVCFPAEGATVLQPDQRIPGLNLWWEDKTNFRS
jgi:hypothetical protein